MQRTRWNEMSPASRAVVVTVAVVDAGLRAWALADLKNRPEHQVNGPKAAWGLALSVVSSAGILPAAYLVLARRPRD